MALNSKRRFAALTGVLAVALTATACGSGDDGGGDTGAAAPASTIDCAPYEAFGDLKGKTVSVYTSITAPEDAPHPRRTSRSRTAPASTIKYEGQGVRGPAAGARQGWQRPRHRLPAAAGSAQDHVATGAVEAGSAEVDRERRQVHARLEG